MKYLILILLLGCTAQGSVYENPPLEYKMKCIHHRQAFKEKNLPRAIYFTRCENNEVICYTINREGASCKWKQRKEHLRDK